MRGRIRLMLGVENGHRQPHLVTRSRVGEFSASIIEPLGMPSAAISELISAGGDASLHTDSEVAFMPS
jgi:hypothetical protein